MAIDYESIGSRIKYIRTQKHMTQAVLAEKAEIGSDHIGRIERGEKAPSLEVMIAIINALEVPADELLVDNLDHSNCPYTGDSYELLLDCTPEENAILIKNMKDLKEILRKYKITK